MSTETFRPIQVHGPHEGRLRWWLRELVDLQLLTIRRFLKPWLQQARGRLIDVGAGTSPWNTYLPSGIEYSALEIDSECFGHNLGKVTYFDGIHLPEKDQSADSILCVEVLEHAREPELLLQEMRRVLKPEGRLLLTIPFSARAHYQPQDYRRYTKDGLLKLLEETGFEVLKIQERGNDIAVIANKLIVLILRLLRPSSLAQLVLWLFLPVLLPLALFFLVLAHLSLLLPWGGSEDPLGYGVIAKPNSLIGVSPSL